MSHQYWLSKSCINIHLTFYIISFNFLFASTAEFCGMQLFIHAIYTCVFLGPLLLTWFNFNPSMDNQSHAQSSVGWNYLSIPKLQRCNRWSLGMEKQFHPTEYYGCNYLSMLGLKLNHASKNGALVEYWSVTLLQEGWWFCTRKKYTHGMDI